MVTLGPFAIGWHRLPLIQVVAFGLSPRTWWDGWSVEAFGRGLTLAVRITPGIHA